MHSKLLIVPTVALFSLTTLALPHDNNVMKRNGRANDPNLNGQRADAVKAAFEYAWNGYKTYAFPHDELRPVSNGFSDSRYVQ
jgi:mannosyl-oligosaccharide alpha-1,2-mannosidase